MITSVSTDLRIQILAGLAMETLAKIIAGGNEPFIRSVLILKSKGRNQWLIRILHFGDKNMALWTRTPILF